MTKILSFDAVAPLCSAALFYHDKIIDYRVADKPLMQASYLVPMIRDMLADNDCSYDDLGEILLNVGPGSFSGIRIGMAAARGIELVVGTPIIAINALACIAAMALESLQDVGNIIALIEAGKGKYYAQHFDINLAPLGSPLLYNKEDITEKTLANRSVYLVGEVANIGVTIPKLQIAKPNASDIAYMFRTYGEKITHEFKPLYIREASVYVKA